MYTHTYAHISVSIVPMAVRPRLLRVAVVAPSTYSNKLIGMSMFITISISNSISSTNNIYLLYPTIYSTIY